MFKCGSRQTIFITWSQCSARLRRGRQAPAHSALVFAVLARQIFCLTMFEHFAEMVNYGCYAHQYLPLILGNWSDVRCNECITYALDRLDR